MKVRVTYRPGKLEGFLGAEVDQEHFDVNDWFAFAFTVPCKQQMVKASDARL
jgi:hypothetical protein